MGDGIHVLLSRVAGLVLRLGSEAGSCLAAAPRDGGKEEQPPESFSSPSWNIGGQTQSTLANDFLTKKIPKNPESMT